MEEEQGGKGKITNLAARARFVTINCGQLTLYISLPLSHSSLNKNAQQIY